MHISKLYLLLYFLCLNSLLSAQSKEDLLTYKQANKIIEEIIRFHLNIYVERTLFFANDIAPLDENNIIRLNKCRCKKIDLSCFQFFRNHKNLQSVSLEKIKEMKVNRDFYTLCFKNFKKDNLEIWLCSYSLNNDETLESSVPIKITYKMENHDYKFYHINWGYKE